MSENTYKPRNLRIIRHVTKNRILDIQDALEIDKLRIELVEFAEGEGAKLSVEHYAEPDSLALVCYDILQGRPWEKYVEFKGAIQGEHGHRDGAPTAVSRVLTIERVEARNPIKITVSRGPGKVTGQGAIQPLGRPEATLSVLLSEFDARRIALTLLRHLAAYEAATYHARVAAGTRKPAAEPERSAVDQQEPELPEEVRPEAATPAAAPESPAEAPPAQVQPQPAPAPHSQPAPVVRFPRRRPAPAVETFWMAAERLGLSRSEAEHLLHGVNGDWTRAWHALRQREREAMTG